MIKSWIKPRIRSFKQVIGWDSEQWIKQGSMLTIRGEGGHKVTGVLIAICRDLSKQSQMHK